MFPAPEQKILGFEGLAELSARLHRERKKIVTTNGCFDLLHWGHIKYLHDARALGDVLICGINADASVRRLKGPDRPIWDERVRALQLAGLACVDYVAVFVEDTPVRFVEAVRPDVHVKGGDYEGRDVVEKGVVEKLGGRMVCVPLVPGFSTTGLIEKLLGHCEPEG